MLSEQVRLIDLIDDMCSGKDIFFKSVRFVEDVMTKDVKTLFLDDTVGTCIDFMVENRVRHIPVIDRPTGEEETPYLVGIVSQRDVIRQVSPYLGKIGETNLDSRAARQPLSHIISRNMECVSPETPIPDAIAIMVDNHIDMLSVICDQSLVGIITSTDILKLFVRLDALRQVCQEEKRVKQNSRFIDIISGNSDELMSRLSSVLRTVEDIMTAPAVCLDEEESLTRAMDVMKEGNFRHIPIVGKSKTLVGIISDRDVLYHLPFHSSQLRQEEKKFRSKLFNIVPNEPALKQTVGHIMHCNTVHVPADCDFYAAVKKLYETKISCLPVVDEGKKLLGIVTVTDVMRGLLAIYTLFEKAIV